MQINNHTQPLNKEDIALAGRNNRSGMTDKSVEGIKQ